MTEMSPERIREVMAYNEHAARVRSLYHRVRGELIVFRMTFEAAPEFTVLEDVEAGTVTVSTGTTPPPLVLNHADYAAQTAIDQLRVWIQQHIDVSALRLGKRRTPSGAYWRSRATR